jgi:hypothetical protein
MNRFFSVLIPLTPALIAIGCSNSIDNPSGGGGTTSTGGSSTTTGGTGTTGGSGTTAGTSSGGTSSGGATSGGSGGVAGSTTAGGSGGAGGANGGTGGTSSAGSSGQGGDGSTITISSTDSGAFDNSFLITPCKDSGNGYDCLNDTAQNNCPTTPWKYDDVQTTEATGNTYEEVFTVSGGDPAKIYDVTVHVLGQAEGRTYVNGMRSATGATDPAAAVSDLLYIGGAPGTSRTDYNVFQLTITGGTPVAGAPTYYAFNAVDTSHEGQHHNYAIDSTFTMKVHSGQTIKLTAHDSNCRAIMNCGTSATPYAYTTAQACTDHARATPASVTLPATFRGATIKSPDKFQTQFLNFKVTKIMAE